MSEPKCKVAKLLSCRADKLPIRQTDKLQYAKLPTCKLTSYSCRAAEYTKFKAAKMSSCQAAELPSCQAAELPSCQTAELQYVKLPACKLTICKLSSCRIYKILKLTKLPSCSVASCQADANHPCIHHDGFMNAPWLPRKDETLLHTPINQPPHI